MSKFDWIAEFIEMFGCDWETAEKAYHYQNSEVDGDGEA